MILIAVALLLAAWGAYSMTRDNSDDPTVTAPATSTAAPASQAAPASAAAAPASSAAPAPASAAAAPATGAQAPAAQASEIKQVHVLNNSTVQGLAASVADQLKAKGYETGEVGNFPDTIVPENTVYYTAGNAAAEQAARTLADKVGGVAAVRPDNLPAGTDDPNSLVLVLATETTVK